jgi:hypothetical protein
MEEQGGLQAMMHDLLERKITSNLNKAIETEALEIQRSIYKATGDSVDIWLDECIGKEDLGCPDVGDDGSRSTKWPEDVDRMDLFNAYMTWANDKKMRTKGNAHFYRKVEQYGFVKHRPRATGGARKWRYKAPPHEGFDTQSCRCSRLAVRVDG